MIYCLLKIIVATPRTFFVQSLSDTDMAGVIQSMQSVYAVFDLVLGLTCGTGTEHMCICAYGDAIPLSEE